MDVRKPPRRFTPIRLSLVLDCLLGTRETPPYQCRTPGKDLFGCVCVLKESPALGLKGNVAFSMRGWL